MCTHPHHGPWKEAAHTSLGYSYVKVTLAAQYDWARETVRVPLPSPPQSL